MAASRKVREAFGMSVLDMLCCGFGAAALLLILRDLQAAQHSKEKTEEAEQKVAMVNTATDSIRRYTEQLDRAEAVRVRRLASGSSATTAAFGISLEKIHRAIVIVDTSGSMRVFTQGEAATSSMWNAAAKWQRTVDFIDDLLLSTAQLESVAVLGIDDRSTPADSCGECFLLGSASDPWIDVSGERLIEIHERLSAIKPSGGSNHLPTLEAALRLIRASESGKAVDAVFLLTDGLPNAGISEPVPAGTLRTCLPSTRCVPVADKRQFADQVIARIAPALAEVHAHRDSFRFHVIGLEWPDDAELPAFALALAAPTQGMVLFP